MKVVQVNYSDRMGGAARAAYRIHQSLILQGLTSTMRVINKSSNDPTVIASDKVSQILARIRKILGRLSMLSYRPAYPCWHSAGIFTSGLSKELNSNNSDLVHLHWIGDEMMSVKELGKLEKPVIWTLHDMWAFCGSEHCVEDSENARFRNGYRKENRPRGEKGRDINRKTWLRKKKYWHKPRVIVCPSRWLANCAKQSTLFKDWDVRTIGNPIDLRKWRPVNKNASRQKLQLDQSDKVILFGAHKGGQDPNKGVDLLLEALIILRELNMGGLQLLTFGKGSGEVFKNVGFPLVELGSVDDDEVLIEAYSAADVMVVPSRIEAFGQTASESQACGTPVVAFNTSGLKDIVKHKQTGYLATPFYTEDLARGILWVLEDSRRRSQLSKNAESRIKEKYSFPVVSEKYYNLYNELFKYQ